MKTSNHNIQTVRNYFGRIVALVLIAGLSAFAVSEQVSFKNVSGSQIKVNATSNIHDWNMIATSFNAEGNFVLNGGQLQDITALNFTLPLSNLKGKEDLLTTRAHKALKAEQFNKITFKLTNATVVQQQKVIKATGNLTIAGVTKPVTLQTTYTVSGNEVIIKGSETIKMSDYGIKAPTFMMGALKVANDVTVDINLKIKN